MDSIDDLLRKIHDYERNRVRYERMIVRLQDELFNKDHEILRAKFTLLQAFPELNPPDVDPFVDIQRIPGYVNIDIFRRACREAYVRDPSDDASEDSKISKADAVAEIMHPHWRDKIDGNWRLYIEVEGEGGVEMMETPEISEIRDKYGVELYNAIKFAWLEVQERRRTGVTRKPWNYDDGREQTLTELLDALPAQVQIIRDNH